MVPKGNGFNQSDTASCCCARTLRRFSGWPAMARDGEVIQREHFCHHRDTICLPNAPVPLKPAVLRFIPEPPGHPGSWTGVNRVKMTFFAEKSRRSTVEALKDPGAPRGTPVHPGRAPAGPRFIPALTRFTPVLGPVLHGSPRSMPAEPR